MMHSNPTAFGEPIEDTPVFHWFVVSILSVCLWLSLDSYWLVQTIVGLLLLRVLSWNIAFTAKTTVKSVERVIEILQRLRREAKNKKAKWQHHSPTGAARPPLSLRRTDGIALARDPYGARGVPHRALEQHQRLRLRVARLVFSPAGGRRPQRRACSRRPRRGWGVSLCWGLQRPGRDQLPRRQRTV